MNSKLLRAALYVTSALTAVAGAPALAQEATMDTVVVTARRMDERLQDVPISITVFNQQQLTNRNVASGADLSTYTPSLTANTRFGTNNTTFAVRGFVQELRTTASVAVYFADVVAPRGGNGGQPAGDGAVPGSFFDLQNVQVLKGPQGTLFGRNTTGGAVLLVPQKPTREFEGYVEGSYGNYDMKRLQAVVNLPFNDTARLRLGIDRQERDGYVKNISGIGPSRFGDLDYTAVRGSFVADLTEDLENYSIISYNRSKDNGPIAKLTSCNPNVFPFGTLACQHMARQAGAGFFTVQNLREDPENLAEQYQLINTATWRANDNVTVKNIISYSRLKSRIRAESFGALYILPPTLTNPNTGAVTNTGAFVGSMFGFAASWPAAGRNSADQDNFTEELQVQGRMSDDRLIWQAGAYYEESNPVGGSGAQSPINLPCTDVDALQCTNVVGLFGRNGVINYAVGEVAFQNKGLYTQATYQLNEQFKLTGGLRYTWDRSTSTAQQITYLFPTPNTPRAICTLASTTPANCYSSSKQKSDKPTWLIGVDYNPTQDVLIYGKYARGYRQGAVNYAAPEQFQTFGPEKVDTYEIGAKTSFHGPVSGSFNIAAFYNDFRNQQLAVGLISSTNLASPTQAIINGGKSRIWGIEADATVRPFSGLTIDASYAYLNTELKSLDAPTGPVGPYDIFQFQAIPGSRLGLTPEHKGTLTATYQLPVSEDLGDIYVGATYAFTGNYVVVAAPQGGGVLPSVELLNLNLNWNNVARKPVDLALFATNVTNEKYYTNYNDQRASQGFVSQQMAAPRMYGVRVRYRFGG